MHSKITISLALLLFFVACKPDPVQLHVNEGHKLYKQGKYKEAVEAYRQATTLDPKRADAWKWMGYAYLEQKDLEQAVNCMNQLAELQEKEEDKIAIYKKIAGMAAKMGELRKAIEYYEKILELRPDDRSSVAWIGVLYGKIGGVGIASSPGNREALQQSIEYLDRAISMNPDDKNVYIHERTAYAKLIEMTKKEIEEAKSMKDKGLVADLEEELAGYEAKMRELGAKWAELTKKEKARQGEEAPPQEATPTAAPAKDATAAPAKDAGEKDAHR